MAIKWSFRKKKKEENLTKPQRFFRGVGDYLGMFAGFMLAFALLFRVVMVDGPSMNQTLVNGDRLLLLSRALYRNPQQGDIVVVSTDSFREGENLVKRVIATEGQTVDIDFESRTVYVDGVALEEDYVYFSDDDARAMIQEGTTFPLTVEEGCIFILGDNRNNSTDSRDPRVGQIDCREILGKVIFLMLPGNDDGRVAADLSRIGVIR